MNSLTKKSYSLSIDDIKNRTDLLLDMTENISENFDNKFSKCVMRLYIIVKKLER